MNNGAGEGGAESKEQQYQAMKWRPLQSLASKRGVLERGMGRDEIVAALVAADSA